MDVEAWRLFVLCLRLPSTVADVAGVNECGQSRTKAVDGERSLLMLKILCKITRMLTRVSRSTGSGRVLSRHRAEGNALPGKTKWVTTLV